MFDNSWRLFFLVFGLSALLISCENDLQEVRAFISTEEVKVEEIFSFEMFYSDSAIVRVRITGPHMKRFVDPSNPTQEFPEGVLVEFFDPNGQITSRLTSKYAIRSENDSEVLVRDSVVWESVNREKLETTELIWDEKAEKVYTNKFVTIRRPEEIIYGHGFESNQEFTYSKIKAIEGKIKVEELSSDAFQ